MSKEVFVLESVPIMSVQGQNKLTSLVNTVQVYNSLWIIALDKTC